MVRFTLKNLGKTKNRRNFTISDVFFTHTILLTDFIQLFLLYVFQAILFYNIGKVKLCLF